ncbi:MAG: dockerin type I domain-containing protein [Lachnospirales bacterium]
MKFRSLLCSVLASTMVIGSCVCANAATFTAGSENATAGNVVSVPITVAPSAGETSTDVNAYAIAISYDSSVLTPVVKGTDEVGDNTYATVGDSFNSGVLTADLKDNETGNDEVLIGWAAASPVNVTEASTLATVDFTVNANATGSTDVKVAVAQVANSASALADESTIEAAAGTVTVDTAFIYGDANGNGKVDSDDVSLTAQSSLSLLEFTSTQLKACDVNGNGKIDSDDVSYIAQKSLGLISSFPVENE